MATAKKTDIWKRIHEMLSGAEKGIDEGERLRVLRETWRRRAEELAKPPQEQEESLLWEKVIVFKVGTERYAFKVEDVEEVIRVSPITPVPCVPPHFAGVINRRGSILPLVDLRVFFGGKKAALTRESRVLVLSRDRMNLGLLVEAADKITRFPPESVRPPMKRGRGIHEEFSSGVITLGKKVIVLLDAARLLTDGRMRVDEGA